MAYFKNKVLVMLYIEDILAKVVSIVEKIMPKVILLQNNKNVTKDKNRMMFTMFISRNADRDVYIQKITNEGIRSILKDKNVIITDYFQIKVSVPL